MDLEVSLRAADVEALLAALNAADTPIDQALQDRVRASYARAILARDATGPITEPTPVAVIAEPQTPGTTRPTRTPSATRRMQAALEDVAAPAHNEKVCRWRRQRDGSYQCSHGVVLDKHPNGWCDQSCCR